MTTGTATRRHLAVRDAVGAADFDDAVEVLDLELERALVFGNCRSGRHPMLRCVEDWAWVWLKWADRVLPKVIRFLPGRRPVAMYVIDAIPPRPLQRPIPARLMGQSLYVPDGDGRGRTIHNLPEPWQRSELLHLIDLGLADEDEIRRARTRPGSHIDYVFEIARFR